MSALLEARRLTGPQVRKLRRLVRRGSTDTVRYRQAMLIPASSSSDTAPVIARLVAADRLLGLHPPSRGVRAGALDGSIEDSYDNAVIESFWSRMQVELLDRRRRRTRLEPANAICESLEIVHNRQCRHPAIGSLTPVESENRQPSTVA